MFRCRLSKKATLVLGLLLLVLILVNMGIRRSLSFRARAGFVAEDEKWYYASDSIFGGRVYRAWRYLPAIRIPIGRSPLVPSGQRSYDITLRGEWLYYSADDGLRRVTKNGGTDELLVEGRATYWKVSSDGRCVVVRSNTVEGLSVVDVSSGETNHYSGAIEGIAVDRFFYYRDWELDLFRVKLGDGEMEYVSSLVQCMDSIGERLYLIRSTEQGATALFELRNGVLSVVKESQNASQVYVNNGMVFFYRINESGFNTLLKFNPLTGSRLEVKESGDVDLDSMPR